MKEKTIFSFISFVLNKEKRETEYNKTEWINKQASANQDLYPCRSFRCDRTVLHFSKKNIIKLSNCSKKGGKKNWQGNVDYFGHYKKKDFFYLDNKQNNRR